jgi:hypothetical protein
LSGGDLRLQQNNKGKQDIYAPSHFNSPFKIPTTAIKIDSQHHKIPLFNINSYLYYYGQDQFQQHFHKQNQGSTRYIQRIFQEFSLTARHRIWYKIGRNGCLSTECASMDFRFSYGRNYFSFPNTGGIILQNMELHHKNSAWFFSHFIQYPILKEDYYV